MKTALRLLLAPYRFSVDRLFRMGQVGWHWQFDDPLKRVGIPYEWVDTAGTTPVTAVGEGIGLLLGREYGGATGPSLLANGTTGLTGTATAASYNTSTFSGSVSRAGDASNQSWVTWTGLATSAVHRIRITNTGATSLDVRNGGVAGTIVASIAAGASTWVHPATTGGSTSITITATSNSTTATFTLGQFAVLPGTHLIQATGTARPTLSARVNLLTYTEQFDNAAWSKSSATVTANATTDPLGGSTADKIIASAATAVHNVVQTVTLVASTSYVYSVDLKAAEYGWAIVYIGTAGAGKYINLSTGATGGNFIGAPTSCTTRDRGNGWWRVTMTFSSGAGGASDVRIYPTTADGTSSFLGDGTSGIYAWGADLRTADDANKAIPAYQRVGATAADHDTDGFPHFCEGDGTDNCWASVATVDGSATDKVTVVSAFTKNSDAAQAVLIEHGASPANVAEWGIGAPGAPGVSSISCSGRSSAGSAGNSGESPTGFAAPFTGVVASSIDWSAAAGSEVLQWVNGARATGYFNGTIENTGVFGNKTLNVLSRAGSSLRFNGRFYGSTGRFGPMSDSERANLTRWWQRRIGTA